MVQLYLVRWTTAVAVLLAAGSAAWAQPEPSAANLTIAALCDKLAADPADPNRPEGVAGVPSSAMDPSTAAVACQTAVDLMPEVPRLAYNLGRALLASGNSVEAYAPLKSASDAGYGVASWLIGEMHAKGQGFPVDAAKAEVFRAKAGSQGFTPPVDPAVKAEEDYRLGMELQKFDTYGFRNADLAELQMAETYLAAAAEANHPGARQALVDLRLSGEPFDEKAAFDDLIAFAETGDPWAQTTLADRLIVSRSAPMRSSTRHRSLPRR